jgi:hypothetical protein
VDKSGMRVGELGYGAEEVGEGGGEREGGAEKAPQQIRQALAVSTASPSLKHNGSNMFDVIGGALTSKAE